MLSAVFHTHTHTLIARMSLSLICLSALFFLRPCLSSSCPWPTKPLQACNTSIEIKPPFLLVNDTLDFCEGAINIKCHHNYDTAMVYPLPSANFRFSLEDISYAPEPHSPSKLIVSDPSLQVDLNSSSCGNLLLSFLTQSDERFDYNQYLSLSKSINSFCTSPNLSSQRPIFNGSYSLNFSSRTGEYLPTNCFKKAPNASFEWTFSVYQDGSVFLLSANYSYNLLSQQGCFYQNQVEDSCGKTCNGHNDNTGRTNHRARKSIVLLGSLGGVLLFIVLVVLLTSLKLSRKSSAREKLDKLLEQYGSLAPKRYKYSELKKITHSFQDKLGKGGFGTVFKGTEPDGHMVAVKILHDSISNGEEFQNEVVSISRTSHVNVVSLLGFCIEGSKRALVYDYMPKKSLDAYIYSENPKTVLGWDKLYDIALGVARGLEYLHRGCSTCIVHFDIKPQNILLDEDFCPKIADFGLAKLCPPKKSVISSMDYMRGTIGFIAPEVYSRSVGVVSTKSDVYSYGMMVLDMVGGRKNAKLSAQSSSEVLFPHWIYDCVAKGGGITGGEVMNETDELAKKMALVGLWCTQTIPANRPSMSRVVEMLERSLSELELPPKPCNISPPPSWSMDYSILAASSSGCVPCAIDR